MTLKELVGRSFKVTCGTVYDVISIDPIKKEHVILKARKGKSTFNFDASDIIRNIDRGNWNLDDNTSNIEDYEKSK